MLLLVSICHQNSKDTLTLRLANLAGRRLMDNNIYEVRDEYELGGLILLC